MTRSDIELWWEAYLAALRAGAGNALARATADVALDDVRDTRRELMQRWRPRADAEQMVQN